MPNKPTVSASITAAASELGIEPPTEEQIARIQGATVVLLARQRGFGAAPRRLR